jgi:hypothetical protein
MSSPFFIQDKTARIAAGRFFCACSIDNVRRGEEPISVASTPDRIVSLARGPKGIFRKRMLRPLSFWRKSLV